MSHIFHILDSEAAFWALLFCLKVLMEKLESTFWLLTNFDDAPKTTFRLILSHSLHEKELKTLANKPLEMKQDVSEDEVTLSQVAEKDIEDLEEAKRTEKHLVQPFFWMLPYIVTVLDLEDFCENITCDVIMHLVTLLSSSEFDSIYKHLRISKSVLNLIFIRHFVLIVT